MENEEKFIEIEDSEGNLRTAEVLFTFEDNDDKYVLFTFIDELDTVQSLEDSYEVLVYLYEELEDGSIGELVEIDENDTYRWNIVEEVFNTFNETQFMYAEE